MDKKDSRKKNLLKKLWLKYTDAYKYKIYKWELQAYSDAHIHNFATGEHRLSSVEDIQKYLKSGHSDLHIGHGGNAGDIIYALATLKRIFELTGANITLHLVLNRPSAISEDYEHPLGRIMLNNDMARRLIPLLSIQPYLRNSLIWDHSHHIQIDLDYFRSGLFPLDRGNIARWPGYMIGVNPQLWKPWLFVKETDGYRRDIVIARSNRYRNPRIDYSFLANYSNLLFVGIKSEYEDIRKSIPSIQWVQTDDFAELASIIASCRLFIGNQSFPYSLAEALKIPRILETCYYSPNVLPDGENGYDFLFQEHFEWLVDNLINEAVEE